MAGDRQASGAVTLPLGRRRRERLTRRTKKKKKGQQQDREREGEKGSYCVSDIRQAIASYRVVRLHSSVSVEIANKIQERSGLGIGKEKEDYVIPFILIS